MSYNIIIPVTERNLQTLNIVVTYLRENVFHEKIVCIGKRFLEKDCKEINCKFIDEDHLYEGLTYTAIRDMIIARDKYSGWRTGWYLQQFLKMAYAFSCKDDYYLIWDADTIPVNRIEMFSQEGCPFFDVKEEYHRPYFTLMNKLFHSQIKRENEFSYISEHMLINVNYMRKMICEIEADRMLKGNNFYQKIINTILDIDLGGSGFSEFETYGNYVYKKFPGIYQFRRLRSLRNGDRYLHYPPVERELKWAAESYDIITMENYQNRQVSVSEKLDELMEKMTLEEVVTWQSRH